MIFIKALILCNYIKDCIQYLKYILLFISGTFLLSYLIITIIFGVPLLFLEITLGQFCQQGTTKLWRAVPLLKGSNVVYLSYFIL